MCYIFALQISKVDSFLGMIIIIWSELTSPNASLITKNGKKEAEK